MFELSPTITMLFLDALMIIYTLWAIGSSEEKATLDKTLLGGLFAWLALLHLGLSNTLLFPEKISGIFFLLIIFAGVGIVGAILLFIPKIRTLLFGLEQKQLLLLQGIRVFFGGTFLMHASLGILPQSFGIIDGFTHIGAGFFGLIAAYSLSTKNAGKRRAWFANIFGIVDILIVASTLALILLPQIGTHHPMMYAVFLPAPLWFWFHLISIWKLLHDS